MLRALNENHVMEDLQRYVQRRIKGIKLKLLDSSCVGCSQSWMSGNEWNRSIFRKHEMYT